MSNIFHLENFFKLCLVAFFSYYVNPIFLIIRDWIIWCVVTKFIFTHRLFIYIDICESDRSFLVSKFNLKQELILDNGFATYRIDNVKVSQEDFLRYEKAHDFHFDRFLFLDAKIERRSNLVKWLSKYYKQADYDDVLKSYRTESFNLANSKFI